MKKYVEKCMKKMKMLDWALAKLGTAAFMVFLFGAWPWFRIKLLSVSPWYFFAISLVAIAIVQFRIKKK